MGRRRGEPPEPPRRRRAGRGGGCGGGSAPPPNIIIIIIIIINITAAGAVDRELLYIEVGNLSPPHQQQQQQQRTTTTINNNNNNQQWHVCVSPWNVGAGGRARGRARGGRRLILWTLLRQSGEAASARAKGPQRKVQKRDWCRKKCCNTFRIVFRIFFDFL